MARTTDWRSVWARKGDRQVAAYTHEALIELDGFDRGAGRIAPATFVQAAAEAIDALGLAAGMSVLEVGCGAGAFLWGFRGRGLRLFGVDYSPALIAHARAAIPEGTFAVAEATSLPFRADAIVSFSVFQYFPDLAYARRVLAAFADAAPVALVLDVPDLATREEAERARAVAGSTPSTHLYYPRSFFGDAETWTNALAGYGNGPFRFNALLRHRPGEP